MRIILSDFISLDGVVQAPGGPEEDTEGGVTGAGPLGGGDVIGAIRELTDRDGGNVQV